MANKRIVTMSKILKSLTTFLSPLVTYLTIGSLLAFSMTTVHAFDNSEAEEILLISAYEGDIAKVKDLLAKKS